MLGQRCRDAVGHAEHVAAGRCRSSTIPATTLAAVKPAPLSTVVAALESRYPPRLAEDWDRVGLVCGDPTDEVRRVLFAVDPTLAVARQAVETGAQLLVTHHPLMLRGVHSVAADTAKGAVVHELIRAGCGLLAMHTNADAADQGTNTTLVQLLGVEGAKPLLASDPVPMEKLTVHVPQPHRDEILALLFDAGAGRSDRYDSAAYWTAGTGQFRPLPGANPSVGGAGRLEQVTEERVEVVFPASARSRVLAALDQHPYEEPAYDIVALQPRPAELGVGRIGQLAEPTTVAGLARRVAEVLPATTTGVRVAGDPQAPVRTVAICSGAGESLLATVRGTGADVYLTGDLRHHPVEEHLAAGGCPVIDMSHWASEWPWLAGAAANLESDLAGQGFTVVAHVSEISTDPWSMRVGSPN